MTKHTTSAVLATAGIGIGVLAMGANAASAQTAPEPAKGSISLCYVGTVGEAATAARFGYRFEYPVESFDVNQMIGSAKPVPFTSFMGGNRRYYSAATYNLRPTAYQWQVAGKDSQGRPFAINTRIPEAGTVMVDAKNLCDPARVVSETPFEVLLPLAAAGAAGTAVVIRRRRSRTATPTPA